MATSTVCDLADLPDVGLQKSKLATKSAPDRNIDMISVAADLRDLFAGEVAKNKRLVFEIDRIQMQACEAKQQANDWKVRSEKMSLEADLCKRENLTLQREVDRLNNAVTKERTERQNLAEELHEVKQLWRSENEENAKKIEELRCLTEAFAKTIKDLEAKLEIAERPPTHLIDTVNSVRAAADEEIKTRMSTQESYYERRLELANNELQEYRKQYSDLRIERQSAEIRAKSAVQSEVASQKNVTETAAAERSNEEAAPMTDRLSSKLSAEPDDEDMMYLLSPRPGSTLTYTSEASADMRKQLQQRSARPRSHKALKSNEMLNAAVSMVARPMSAPIKKQSVTNTGSNSNGSTKPPSYIGDATDYYESVFGGRKQVTFGNNDDNKAEGNNAADSGGVLSVGGVVRITCVHPDGLFIRLRNTSDATEEIGGFRVLQMVDGQPAAIYRFVPSASVAPKGKVTIWAGSRLTAEQTRRLKTDAENIVWKDLEAWGAGLNCTTIFAKSTGEAQCWVHGAVMLDTAKTELPPAEAQTPKFEQPEVPQAVETLEDEADEDKKKLVDDPFIDVIWKPSNASEPQKRSKSPYMLTPEERPKQQTTSTRRPSRLRVDEFDFNNANSSPNANGEERVKTQLSVSDTQPLRAYANAQKLASQGLHALKAPHNLRFQPSMFTSKFPLAQS